MASHVSSFSDWLGSLKIESGYPAASELRSFAHDEDDYDARHLVTGDPVLGRGMVELLRAEGIPMTHPILEIGCGTGALSVGLAAYHTSPLLVLTDPSPGFLRMLERRLDAAKVADRQVAYCALSGDDLEKVPAESLSVVCLRHTLHHITDVEKFAAQAHRALIPGGCLVFEEPFAEALLMMGAMAQFIPTIAKAKDIPVTKEQLDQIDLFGRTIQFYSRQDLDKATAEDKHLFRPAELGRLMAKLGYQSQFYTNHNFGSFIHGVSTETQKNFFSSVFRGYLVHLMGFGESFGTLFDRTMASFAEYVDIAAQGGLGPCYVGIGLCRKVA